MSEIKLEFYDLHTVRNMFNFWLIKFTRDSSLIRTMSILKHGSKEKTAFVSKLKSADPEPTQEPHL